MNRKGFSLVQVLIAVALLGLAYIPASSVFIASTRNIQSGDLKLMATLEAQTLIDVLRMDNKIYNYKEQLIELPNIKFPGIDLSSEFKKNFNGIAQIHIKADLKYPERLRLLTITVNYDLYGNKRDVKLSTLAADMSYIHHRSWK